ncbi:DUF3300 domain-containing protein [Xanthobacter oligotrophicus]|uniref:DUF3300 domain-containing protein n=1 Tax=Xanthobacter oligotrophicus TaxID=2607286 RepID=A0ABW6ZYY4_9HYPH
MKGRAGNWSRVAVAAVFGWSTAVYPVLAQTPPADPQVQPVPQAQPVPPVPPAPEVQPAPAVAPVPPPPAAAQAPLQAPLPVAPTQPANTAPIYSLSDLEYLLGPLALYPDPLLAILFPATLFPEQIVDAYNWIEANPRRVQARNFAAIDAKNWDSSVKALIRFPDVIRQLHDHMEWTESLGLAFSTQPQDVSNTIQMLRAKAQSVGNLKTTPQQVVTTREEGGQRTIYIQPANPERVYVPVYDSSDVFTTFATGALLFGGGVLVGSAWNNRWGWNNRGWNTVWVNPPGWNQPPHWGPGWGGGRPPAWGPGPWRPGRPPGWQPGQPDRPVRPDRPGGPNRPGFPDRPGTGGPNRPGFPDRPGAGPNRPGIPDRPGAGPNRPGLPDRPGAGPNRPDRPGAGPNRPDRPGAGADRPNRPGAGTNRPERPSAGQNRPNQRPNAQRPSQRPNAGQNRSRPQQSRPQQNARPRPQQNARPQQRARPQQNARPQQHARPQQNARPQQQRARPQGGGERRR